MDKYVVLVFEINILFGLLQMQGAGKKKSDSGDTLIRAKC